jgi:hypothetical protein
MKHRVFFALCCLLFLAGFNAAAQDASPLPLPEQDASTLPAPKEGFGALPRPEEDGSAPPAKPDPKTGALPPPSADVGGKSAGGIFGGLWGSGSTSEAQKTPKPATQKPAKPAATPAQPGTKGGGDSQRTEGGQAASEAPKQAPPSARVEPEKKSGGGGTLGYGFMNLALGLGSFVQGDFKGGLTTLLSYGVATGLIVWELTLDYEDDLAGIPGTVGLGVAGFAVLYGFIRPALYQRSRTLAGIMDGINIAAVPGNYGGTAVRLSYTVKY